MIECGRRGLQIDLSLEGLEIRFTVSNGQDLFDFPQKSPIVLGQERNGARSPTRRNWMQDLLVKSKDIVTRYGAEQREQKRRKGYQTLGRGQEKGAICITGRRERERDPFPHFFRFRRRAQLVIHGECGGQTKGRGAPKRLSPGSLLSYRL